MKVAISHNYIASILLVASAAKQLWSNMEKVLQNLCQAEILSCLGNLEIHFRAVLGLLYRGRKAVA